MYKNKFVVAVRNGGKKILREIDGNVILPFGCEYSILLKNLESRKARVKVSIDGKDVLGQSSLILNPHQEINLDGFLEHNIIKNRFKFIEKTQQISEFRGDRIDDGIIRVEIQFEKEKPKIEEIIEHRTRIDDWDPYIITCTNTGDYYYDMTENVISNNYYYSVSCNNEFQCGVNDNIESKQSPNCVTNKDLSNVLNDVTYSLSFNDQGITVKGSDTCVLFREARIGELEENSTVIVLTLKGNNSKKEKVRDPVTVETCFTCETCGKRSKSSSKFCDRCGTRLI